jgi:hypothetical protein
MESKQACLLSHQAMDRVAGEELEGWLEILGGCNSEY